MTILHEYAGKLLNARKALVLPPVGARLGKRRRVHRQAKEYRFDAATLETMDGETVPDVILYKGEHRMHVEVYVTHRCSEEKRAKIRAAEIAAIEIDLSGVDRDATVTVVDQAILAAAPREWLFNRRIMGLLKELQAEAAAEAQAAQRRRQEAVRDLAASYVVACEAALAAPWRDSKDIAKITEAGDANLLSGGAGGEGYFTVHPRVWKAAVLNLLHGPFGGFSAASMEAEFTRRGWLVARLRDASDEDLGEEAGLPPGGPQGAVETFLRYLVRKGIVASEGWRWVYTQRHVDTLQKRVRGQQQRVREEADRALRHTRLAQLATAIVTAANPDAAESFDCGAWLSRSLGATGRSIRQITNAGEKDWRDLQKGLQTTLAVLKDQADEEAETYGLPVGDAVDAIRKMQIARAVQRKREAEEKERQERQGRTDALIREAQEQLGDGSAIWLDKSFQALDGMTPRQAAAESPGKLQTVRWILDQVVAARVTKEKWVAELEREATTLLRRIEHDATRLKSKVDLFMNTSDPSLPNRTSPKAHTKSEVTMQECLALLRKRIGKR